MTDIIEVIVAIGNPLIIIAQCLIYSRILKSYQVLIGEMRKENRELWHEMMYLKFGRSP